MSQTYESPIGVAQIGVGYWGPNLLRNLFSSPYFSVKMVIEKDRGRRQFVEQFYPGIPVYSDISAALNEKNVQAMVIATPVASHVSLGLQSLDAGKHILVEKPMATHPEEVRQIHKAAKSRNLVAMVGHTFIFNAAVKQVKEIIDSGELGDIRYIYAQRLNLGRIRNDVDALWNLAPHDISIIQYWLNDPEPIKTQRIGMAYVQDGIDDVVFLNIIYPQNVMAHIHVSWLDPHKIRQITVVGTKKMVVYDDIAESKIAIYDKGIDPLAVLGDRMDFDTGGVPEFTHRSGDVVRPKVPWREPLQVEIEHFSQCILQGIDCKTGTAHAEKVVGILRRADTIQSGR